MCTCTTLPAGLRPHESNSCASRTHFARHSAGAIHIFLSEAHRETPPRDDSLRRWQEKPGVKAIR